MYNETFFFRERTKTEKEWLNQFQLLCHILNMPNQFYIHVEGVRDDCWCLSEVSWVWSRVTYWVGEPKSYSAVTDLVCLLSQYKVQWRQNVSSCTWGAWQGWQRIYAGCLWQVTLQDRHVSQSRKGQIAPSSKVAKRHFRFSRGTSQGGRLSGCPSGPGPRRDGGNGDNSYLTN